MAAAPPIKAIETWYAGCRFRSRLEARWAVFFDRLGVQWQYEPQSYLVDGGGYLPDFWLPDQELWVEVKGDLRNLSAAQARRLVIAASGAGLPIRPGGELACSVAGRDVLWLGRRRILLLDQIPEPGQAWLHTLLFAVLDQVVRTRVALRNGLFLLQMYEMLPLAHLVLDIEPRYPHGFGTTAEPSLDPDPLVDKAYTAARAARFEHGEAP